MQIFSNPQGIQSSRGAIILFADADGATKFEDLNKLETALADLVGHSAVTEPNIVSEDTAVVIGSRAHLEKESLATRSVFRYFHYLTHLIYLTLS